MTPRATLTVGHVFGRYLPLSEVFVHEWITGMDGLRHHVLASRPENLDRFPVNSFVQPTSDREWIEAPRRLALDLIVCHFGPLGLTGIAMGYAHAVPVVTMFYGYDHSSVLRDPRWVRRYQVLFRNATLLTCNSEAGRGRLVEFGCPPDLIRTVHLGVNLGHFQHTDRRPALEAHGRKHLLTVARLTPKKGLPVACAAVRALLDRGYDVDLTILGEGPERGPLTATIAALGLEGRVRLAGAVDHSAVAAAMGSAHLYLQPSVTAPDGDEEGLPVALTEAMACGLPVVASRHAGIPELVLDGSTGLLTQPGDAVATANAVARLLDTPAFASGLARAARSWVEQEFDRARQGRLGEQLLQAVAAAHRRSASPPQPPPPGELIVATDTPMLALQVALRTGPAGAATARFLVRPADASMFGPGLATRVVLEEAAGTVAPVSRLVFPHRGRLSEDARERARRLGRQSGAGMVVAVDEDFREEPLTPTGTPSCHEREAP